MGVLLIAAFAVLAFILIRRMNRKRENKKFTADDRHYEQNGINFDYATGTIAINGKRFPVKDVTGVTTIYDLGGARHKQQVKIEVEDLVKPVYYIPFTGTHQGVNEFTQRICVAIRKAGGASFI